jgi:hypothetical protein
VLPKIVNVCYSRTGFVKYWLYLGITASKQKWNDVPEGFCVPWRLPQNDFMLWPILTNLFTPRFDWIQVEVTTHCQASCTYCPHTVYREHWAGRHLALATFRRLLPVLKRARLVHLQGW